MRSGPRSIHRELLFFLRSTVHLRSNFSRFHGSIRVATGLSFAHAARRRRTFDERNKDTATVFGAVEFPSRERNPPVLRCFCLPAAVQVASSNIFCFTRKTFGKCAEGCSPPAHRGSCRPGPTHTTRHPQNILETV